MTQPKWVVLVATPRDDDTIDLRFADGTHGVFDLQPLLNDTYYSTLALLPLFLNGHVECGTVVWDNDIDIAPELLYEKCRTL